MTRSRALRSGLISAALVLLGVTAWLTLAPTRVGGSTDYVTTHGNSMAPRFHTGDLAVIRPSDEYRVGDVVAYRSPLLRTVVLHRIIRRIGDRYVFRGDNNDFTDPEHPGRSELIGKLWLHVPQGGVPLGWLRLPLVSAGLLGGIALLLAFSAGPQRRRRRRASVAPAAPPLALAPPVAAAPHLPAPAPPVAAAPHLPAPAPVASPLPSPPPLAAAPQPPAPAPLLPPVPPVIGGLPFPAPAPVAPPSPVEVPAANAPAPPVEVAPAPAPDPEPAPVLALAPPPAPAPPARAPRVNGRQILVASAIAATIFALATLVTFATGTTRTTTVKTPYSEGVTFGYHAAVAPKSGPVYPGGALTTGDPVFLKLVDRVSVSVGYRFAADAPHELAGTMDVLLRVTSPNGWTRDLPLAPATPFDGDRADSEVTLDLARIRKLTRQVETLTGMPAGGTYSLAVIPRPRATGKLAGQPVTSQFSPQMTFQLDALQLRPGAGPQQHEDGLTPSKKRSVGVPHTVRHAFSVRGHELPVPIARWIALVGLLLALGGALLSRLKCFRRPVDPSGRVQSRYGHLIVPIAGIAPNGGRLPIDVTTIDALVALAERGERLILHHHGVDADTYLVDDGSTLFRFRIRRPAADEPLAATG